MKNKPRTNRTVPYIAIENLAQGAFAMPGPAWLVRQKLISMHNIKQNAFYFSNNLFHFDIHFLYK